MNWALLSFLKKLHSSIQVFNSTDINYCLVCNVLNLVIDGKHWHRGEERGGGGGKSQLPGLIIYSRWSQIPLTGV